MKCQKETTYKYYLPRSRKFNFEWEECFMLTNSHCYLLKADTIKVVRKLYCEGFSDFFRVNSQPLQKHSTITSTNLIEKERKNNPRLLQPSTFLYEI